MFEKRPQSRNVFWIEQQLFAAHEPSSGDLFKLLLRELDSFAKKLETLQLLENFVSQCRTRVDRQREIIAEDERADRAAENPVQAASARVRQLREEARDPPAA